MLQLFVLDKIHNVSTSRFGRNGCKHRSTTDDPERSQSEHNMQPSDDEYIKEGRGKTHRNGNMAPILLNRRPPLLHQIYNLRCISSWIMLFKLSWVFCYNWEYLSNILLLAYLLNLWNEIILFDYEMALNII